MYIHIYIYIYNIYIYVYIYGNHKTLISHHGCSYYLVITGHTILQFFLYNNSVRLQYKQSAKSLLYNFNFLNDYTKVKRNNVAVSSK